MAAQNSSMATFIQGLQITITQETSRAMAAEEKLDAATKNQTSVVQAAIIAEGMLNVSLTKEVSRAITVESSLNSSLQSEVNRAVYQDTMLNSSLKYEISRATAEEARIANFSLSLNKTINSALVNISQVQAEQVWSIINNLIHTIFIIL